MRLVLRRAAAAWPLLTAAGLAATIATVLLTALALYAQLLPVAGTRAALAEAPVADRTVFATSAAGEDVGEVAARDAAVRELFAGGLGGAAVTVAAGGYATGQRLPDGLAPEEGSAVVGFLADLPEHANLSAGSWPEPVAPVEDTGAGPVPATLPAAVAAELGLSVGDLVQVSDHRAADPAPAPLVISGLWEPRDPADPYWQLVAAPVERGGWGPFVVHPDTFLARYLHAGQLEWLVAAEPAELAAADLDTVIADLRQIRRELPALRDSRPELDDSLRLRTGLEELSERLQVATVVHRSGMVLPAALLVVVGGYSLVLVARLLAAHRRSEQALLRARGASRRQLLRLAASEALLVVAPAAVLGAPVGTALVRLADRWSADRSLGLEADLAAASVIGPPLAWTVALLAVAGCAAALALPAAGRGRSWVAEQQERSRPSRFAVAQRAGVDLALLVLALLGWLQLRQYGSAVTPSAAGWSIDPLLVAAPVVAVLAATGLALRLLPLATRLGVRLATRSDRFWQLLGMWQADRRPHAGPVLLLVLAVATAVLAPAVAATWQQSQRDQAAQLVGADLRIVTGNPAAAAGSELAAALPEPHGLMPVHRGTVTLPEVGSTALLAVDTDQADLVAKLRPDLTPSGVEQLYAGLRDGRPELSGIPLPGDARRLAGRFQFEAPAQPASPAQPPDSDDAAAQPTRVPPPAPDRLSIHFLDHSGMIWSEQVGRRAADESGQRLGGIMLDQDGRLEFDLALPPDAAMLVGLGMGASSVGFQSGLAPIPERPGTAPVQAPVQVQVRWSWQQLRFIDGDGTATPIQVPLDWQLHGSDAQSDPEPEWDPARLAGRVTLEPARDLPGEFHFQLVAPPPRLTPVPLVVSRDLLAATGGEVGRTVQIGGGAGGLPSARVAEVVDVVPGTVDGSGVLVDLRWLSTHQFLRERTPPVVTEWWVAGPPQPTAQLEQLAWVAEVEDRRTQTARLLGDPLGNGVLRALWAAAIAAGLLAAFGLVVDSRATAVRRRHELAVLHTLGTPPAGLARALVVEQAVLAGLGVAAGAVVGMAVAATMGTSLVLTGTGAVPVPEPLLRLAPGSTAAATAGLLLVAVLLGALVARRARREVASGALRIGED